MINKIIVQGREIGVIDINGEKYISITDMARKFGESNVLIASWIRRKDTIEFLGIWEKLNNEKFNPHEFEGFKSEAGSNRFNLSSQKWMNKTGAIGLKSKSGKYGGGTYAHEEIATHFGQWLSPEFSLYVIKEFKRLKQVEAQRLSKDWQLSRVLSKINYHIHTDAIDKHMIPINTPNKLKWPWFTDEADVLNLAIFGKTARQWRDENPNLVGNIRDYSTQEQLLVLANLESLNSQLIKDGLSKQDRFTKLCQIASEQMSILIRNHSVKKLKN